MSKRIILGTVLSMVAVLAALWLFWPSEEDRIREQFDELSDLASKTEDASPLSGALGIKNFANLFCKEVSLKTRSSKLFTGNYTNHELARRYGRLRVFAKSLDLSFEALEFQTIDENDAKVTVRVLAWGTDKSGKKHGEDFRAEVLLQKLEGEWKFREFAYLGSLP
jgi:hypothetical protein